MLGGTGLYIASKKNKTTTNDTTATAASTQNVVADSEAEDRAGRLAAAKASCGITASTTDGPYYIANTAELKEGDLNYGNLAGTPIKVSGYVFAGADNTTPVDGAKVEIWQADNDGQYHPESNGDAAQYTADQLSLRGYVTTDKYGYYEFTSIFPGEYEGRVRHIHVRASADGYQAVTTQLITPLSGDKVAPGDDMIASSLPSCNQLSFANENGIKTAEFNFNLAKQ